MSAPQQPQQLTPAQRQSVIHTLHDQLRDRRDAILSINKLLHNVSAAFYTACAINTEDSTAEGELEMAMIEFSRRGWLQLDAKHLSELQIDYVRVLKLLKINVDQATSICDRLSKLNNLPAAPSETPSAPTPPPDPAPPIKQDLVLASLHEALASEGEDPFGNDQQD